MSARPFDLTKWNHISLWLGTTAWIGVTLVRQLGWLALDDLHLLLLFAFCVITPLAIPLIPLPKEQRPLCNLASQIILCQPLATLIGSISLLSGRGFLATLEALVWLGFTLLLALLGGMLLLQKSGRQLVTANLAIALIYVPIGSLWLILDRLGLQPLGFSQATVLLTAVHFHFITLAALLMVGLTGQVLQTMQRGVLWKIYCVLASCMLVNPLLVAAGITVTQITGMHWLESAAATLLALCLILFALFNVRFIVPSTTSSLARWLLLISSTAIVFTMFVAGAYALRLWAISIPQMIQVHGWINALVFSWCGLLGWRLRCDQERRETCESSYSAARV